MRAATFSAEARMIDSTWASVPTGQPRTGWTPPRPLPCFDGTARSEEVKRKKRATLSSKIKQKKIRFMPEREPRNTNQALCGCKDQRVEGSRLPPPLLPGRPFRCREGRRAPSESRCLRSTCP